MKHRVPIDSSYHYPGEEITWAGECPITGQLCFGTESGGILIPLLDDSDQETGEAAWLVENLGDVVNGVAFGRSFCAASTPSHVAIIELATGEVVQSLPRGALDVLRLEGDKFLAPAGLAGLVSMDVQNRQVDVREYPVQGHAVYFYSATLLAKRKQDVLVACAARQGGLAYAKVSRTTDQVDVAAHLFPDLDVVSATGIPGDDFPCGVVALATDGSLLIARDVLNERPAAIRFELPGRAYTARTVGQHLAVLTSEGIHVVRDFADIFPQLIEGICSAAHTAVADVRASEIYAAFDRYLLAEIDDGISVVDIDDIFSPTRTTHHEGAWHDAPTSRCSSPWRAESRKAKGVVKSVSLPVAPTFTSSEMIPINS